MPPTPRRAAPRCVRDGRHRDDGEVAVPPRHFAEGRALALDHRKAHRRDQLVRRARRGEHVLAETPRPRPPARRVFASAAPLGLRARRAPAAVRNSDRHARSSRTPCPCCASGNGRRTAAPSASSGSFSASCGHAMSLFCVTAAPISMLLPRSRMVSSAAMRETSISTAGSISRRLSIGSSDWPPARMRASSPYSASSASDLLDRVGPHIIERTRFHFLPASSIAWMRRGVAGSGTSSTPSASAMALAMQAGVLMQLPSASPLAPSGVSGDGDS